MAPQINSTLFGFHVDSVTALPDVEGRMWRFTFEKNGAELVWLERQDDVKTFVIAFKTLPEDDSGVAHILEHSVLAGSEKFPVKSPFSELRKSSLRVFMNAMTARDKTYYPFSTRNDRDFLNLAEVYLDAVFHPTVICNPLPFRQEGWHYELDAESNALVCNGIVYNEMKGVFADPERAAGREVLHLLYPDTVYGNDSGGKPESIPSLTHEAFCAFYAKYYHPSNARIFLDGSVNLSEILPKLAAVLEPYERADAVSEISFQPPVFCSQTHRFEADVCEGKTILADAWSVGTYQDIDRRAALDALVEYLVGSNEAPLKRALVSAGVCEDVKLFWYSYRQMPLILIVRNTTDALAAKCRTIVRDVLLQLISEGLDKARLRAIVDNNEFIEREAESARPRGLVYFSRAINQWLYGGDPATEFDLTGIYSRLRQGIDSGFFEQCLREMMLDNRHHVELTLSPETACETDRARLIQDEQTRRHRAMTGEELARISAEHQALTTYQTREDSAAARASIPALSLADIPLDGTIVDHTVDTEGALTVIKTQPTTNGIVYLSLYFPLDGLGADELVKIPLFARLHGKLATAKREAFALQTDILATVGRMKMKTVAAVRGNYLCVKLAVLASKASEAITLLEEILLETRFDDLQAIQSIHRQQTHAAERHIRMRGDDIAGCYAARTLSRRWASRDILHGYTALRWLQQARVTDALGEDYRALARRIFVRNGLILSYTGNLPPDAEARLKTLFPESDGSMTHQADISFRDSSLQGLRIDGDVGYSNCVAALPNGTAFTGAMRVAAKILSSEYLRTEIREIGGAYGTGMGIIPSGRIACYTYRDPTPVKSIDIIRRSGAALRTLLAGDIVLERFIVATIAEMDSNFSPMREAARPVELYLANRTVAEEQMMRRQVIETTQASLLQIAAILERQLDQAVAFVVGGKPQTESLVTESAVQ